MAKKQKTDRRRPTREYWKRRSEAYNKAVLRRGERFVAEDIYSQYRTAAADIERELAMWYQRFAENNVLTAAQAKVMLNNREMEELRWSLNDYIKNASAGALSPEWMRKVQNASAKAHISRLDAINLALQQQIEKLFGGQADELDALLKDTYREGFYRTAFELDKGFGVATDMSGINMGKLETVVARPWVADGLTFSDRIWRNKETLVSELKNQLAQATIRGDDLPTAVKNLSDRLEVSRSNAARLVMTESAYFATKAQEDCYKELGVGQVEFVATLDDRTSLECQEHDGKVIDVKDIKPGDNAPPLHCWCRSCLAPYFGDKAGRSGTRAARNPETGKTVQVPADIKYGEWKKERIPVESNNKANVQGNYIGRNNEKNGNYTGFLDTASEIANRVAQEIKEILGIADGRAYNNYIPQIPRITDYSQDSLAGLKANIKQVNPRYNEGGPWRKNCSLCVPALELRIRGLGVTANLVDRINKGAISAFIQDNPFFAYTGAGLKPVYCKPSNDNGKSQIIKKMQEWGHNARAQICCHDGGREFGHVFYAVNDNGKIYFADAQSGVIGFESWFELKGDIATMFARVDNVAIKEEMYKHFAYWGS